MAENYPCKKKFFHATNKTTMGKTREINHDGEHSNERNHEINPEKKSAIKKH
jgi:hypothetical protein